LSVCAQNDNTGNRRVQFEDEQLERFDDVPPQNYPTSPQPRCFPTPPVGWNDVNYQPPTQAWGGAGPRFQGTPPWWTNPGPSMVALSLLLPLRWAVAAGQEDLV